MQINFLKNKLYKSIKAQIMGKFYLRLIVSTPFKNKNKFNE